FRSCRLSVLYTRRRFGGRQPLCGIGVTSRIDFTSSPTVCSARIADSRPEPGPFTRTSSDRMPTVFAALPALSAAWVAANGVPLRDPLNPMPPALDHATTFPSVSVMVTTVLLNDAWMCASPWWTMRFSPRFLKVFFRLPAAPSFFSGVALSGTGSVFAITHFFLCSRGPTPARSHSAARLRRASLRRATPTRLPRWGPRRLARAAGAFLMLAGPAFFTAPGPHPGPPARRLEAVARSRLDRLLLGDGTLARAFARPRVGPRPLAAHRQRAPRSEERRVGTGSGS